MHILYSLALGVAAILSAPWWLWKMLRAGKYRAGAAERLGRVPSRIGDASGCVWVHAVSVGEVLAMSPVIAQLRQACPERRIVVSTTTATGQKLARERFGAENVFYLPLDFAFAVRSYLRALQPELVVLAETEFWPNFLRLAKASGACVAVVNGRISDRSLPRYRRFRSLMSSVLGNVDIFLAQTEEDARRLVEIGADGSRVSVAGNLKFDVKPPAEVALVPALRSSIEREQAGAVIVAGSTLGVQPGTPAPAEEQLLLDTFRAVVAEYPKALLVLAPRHPERFSAVAELLAASGVPWARRSTWTGAPLAGSVLLLDTIGELAAVYQLATIAFVGGSLVPAGGHNIVEPARFGVPILVGPHNHNFREVIALFGKADAVRIVSPDTLTREMLSLLRDHARRVQLGRRAAELVEKHAGATARTVDKLTQLLNSRHVSGEGARLANVKTADPTRTAADPAASVQPESTRVTSE